MAFGRAAAVSFSGAGWRPCADAESPAPCPHRPVRHQRQPVDRDGVRGGARHRRRWTAPIEDAAFVVDDGRFVQVGRRGEVQVPAGATRVDLTGKTVIPAIVDTHTHMPTTREALVDRCSTRRTTASAR